MYLIVKTKKKKIPGLCWREDEKPSHYFENWEKIIYLALPMLILPVCNQVVVEGIFFFKREKSTHKFYLFIYLFIYWYYPFFHFLKFYWSTVDLQGCDNFCCTTKYTCAHPFSFRYFAHIDYHRISGRVFCAMQHVPVGQMLRGNLSLPKYLADKHQR